MPTLPKKYVGPQGEAPPIPTSIDVPEPDPEHAIPGVRFVMSGMPESQNLSNTGDEGDYSTPPHDEEPDERTNRPTQEPARDEISRSVMAAVLSRHARNPSDNEGSKGDAELERAQSADSQQRAGVALGRILARSSSLISGRHGKYDDALYDSLDKDAGSNTRDVMQRRKDLRDQQDQNLQMRLGKNQVTQSDIATGSMQDDDDPASSSSQGARELLARIVPQIAQDPAFKNMSASEIKKNFPVLSKEIDAIRDEAKEQHEDARNAATNKTKIQVAELGQNDDYKKSMAEYLRGKNAIKMSEISGRSFQNVVPVPGKIPTQDQAKAMTTAATYHDQIADMVSKIQEKYEKYGANYILPDQGREGLQSDLDQLRIMLNSAEAQGAMSQGHYKTMMNIVSNPDLVKNVARPEFFKQNMDDLFGHNQTNFRFFARNHNYITRGEPDFDAAVKLNAVPTVAPAPSAPIDNPAAQFQQGGGGESATRTTVSESRPVAPGGVVKVKLRQDYKGNKAGTMGSVSLEKFNANPDLYERVQ